MRSYPVTPGCSCRLCRAACETMPGYLVPEDLDALAGQLGITVRELVEQHLSASQGATAMRQGELLQIPTLVPRARQDGSCHWYVDGRCMVHDVAPFGCSAFCVCSRHPQPDAEKLRCWGLYQIFVDVFYKRWWKIAKPVGTSVSARRARLEKRLRRRKR